MGSDNPHKTLAELDQGMQLIVDTFPALWWRLYERSVTEGFTATEALSIVETYITATFKGTK